MPQLGSSGSQINKSKHYFKNGRRERSRKEQGRHGRKQRREGNQFRKDTEKIIT